MARVKFVNFRGVTLTSDTAEAVIALLDQLEKSRWPVQIEGPRLESEWDPLFLALAGREIHLRIKHPEADPQTCLNALWGFAVPGLLTPCLRYPLAGKPGDNVFHFLAPGFSFTTA
jgi:hypothetical protein